MSLSFSTICTRMRAHAIYIGEGLLFPRASELELQACEARLGFPLPPMLRELYLTVANGSDFFGQGYSLATVSRHFGEHGSGYPVLGEFIGDGPRPFDDTTVEALRAHPGAFVVCERVPTGLVEFADLGCEVHAHFDGYSEHIYISDNHSTDGELDRLAFSFGASSLEEWLERRLAEPCSRSSEGRYQPHIPLSDVLDDESRGAQLSQQVEDSPLPSLSSNRTASIMDRFRNDVLTGVEHARADITRQIYNLDAFQRTIAESDAPNYFKRNWLPELGMTMPRLADLEAQLDNLINNSWLYRS